MVKLLFDNGASIEIKNLLKRTAGEEAFDKGFYEISEFLVEKEVSKLKNVEIIENDKEEAELFEQEEMLINQNDLINDNNQNNPNDIDKELN